MASKLDRALSDIIDEDNKSGGGRRDSRGGGRGRRGGGGAARGAVSGGAARRGSGPRSNPLSRDDNANANGNGNENGDEGSYRPQRRERRDRPTPYARNSAPAPAASSASEASWTHDMYHNQGPRQISRSSIANNSKVIISNLDSEVTSNELRTIVAEVGTISQVDLKFDAAGKHLGVAEVVFSTRAEAEACVKEFDGAEVDNRPMGVKLAQPNVAPRHAAPAPAVGKSQVFGSALHSGGGGGDNFNRRPPRPGPRNLNAPLSRPSAPIRLARGGGGASRGGGRGGRGGGRGGSAMRKPQKPASAADLDAEMDAYRGVTSAPAAAPAAASTADA